MTIQALLGAVLLVAWAVSGVLWMSKAKSDTSALGAVDVSGYRSAFWWLTSAVVAMLLLGVLINAQ